MHQITIRLLLLSIRYYDYSQAIQNSNIGGLRRIAADCGRFRRMSTTVNCMRVLSSKAVYLNLRQH